MPADSNFDQMAATWDDDPEKVARAQEVARAIRGRVPLGPGTAGLELGCGTGLLGLALRADLGSLTLADRSEGMLDVLRPKIAGLAGVEVLPFDLEADPLPARRFDLVFTLMTFHHVADVDAALARCHALLKPGGHLCLADLDPEDGSFHGEGFTGHRGFDRADLGRRTREAGFREADFSTPFRIRKEVPGGPKEFPVFLLVAQRG